VARVKGALFTSQGVAPVNPGYQNSLMSSDLYPVLIERNFRMQGKRVGSLMKYGSLFNPNGLNQIISISM
jgi:hypothetical protein